LVLISKIKIKGGGEMNIGEVEKIIEALNNGVIVSMDEALALIKGTNDPPEGLEERLGSLRCDIETVVNTLQSASVDFSQSPPFVQTKIVPKLVSKKK